MKTDMFRIILTMCGFLVNGALSCPTKCTCANQRVNCYAKELMEIPDNIPEDTVHLDLQSNNIELIDPSKINHLTSLQELKLQYNKISTLVPGTFKNLKSLKTLQLSTNSLKRLPASVFEGLQNLTILSITENFITNIDGAFSNLKNIKRLELGNNKIEELKDSSFGDLENLAHLILPNNNISKVGRNVFKPLKNLLYLVLKNNPLRNVDGLFFRNRRLFFLDLTKCSLQTIPLRMPWSVNYLQLRQNNISRIRRSSLARNRYLRILVLDENKINVIERFAFGAVRNLREIWLNGNKLKKFPSPFPPTVTSIFLSKNQITKVSDSDFPAYSQLKSLSIDNNAITQIIPGTFSKTKSLQKLYLNTNKITVLKNYTFSALSKLNMLSLNKNKFRRIQQAAFAGLVSLNTLELAFMFEVSTDIEGNIFGDIPNLKILDLQLSPVIANKILASRNMMSSLAGLTSINLMDNDFETLQPEFMQNFAGLKEIKIAGNKWHCDRRLLFLNDWIKKKTTQFLHSRSIKCHTPRSLRGKPLAILGDSQFVPITSTAAPIVTEAMTSFDEMKTTNSTTSMTSNYRKSTSRMEVTRRQTRYSGHKSTSPSQDTANMSTKQPVMTTKGQTTLKMHRTTRSSTSYLTRKFFINKVSGVPKQDMSTPSANQQTSVKPVTASTKMTRQKESVTRSPQDSTIHPENWTQKVPITSLQQTTNIPNRAKYTSTKGKPVTAKRPLTVTGDQTDSTNLPHKKSTKPSKGRYDEVVTTGNLLTGNKYTATFKDDSKIGSKTGKTTTELSKTERNYIEDALVITTPTSEISESNRDESQVSSVSENHRDMKVIIIATSVSIAVLIVIVIVIVLVIRQYRKNKLVYHRAVQYRQDYTDVTFFVGESSESEMLPKSKTTRTRSDRGSTSSRPSEDITNDIDQSMKVYTLDDE